MFYLHSLYRGSRPAPFSACAFFEETILVGGFSGGVCFREAYFKGSLFAGAFPRDTLAISAFIDGAIRYESL